MKFTLTNFSKNSAALFFMLLAGQFKFNTKADQSVRRKCFSFGQITIVFVEVEYFMGSTCFCNK